MADITDQIEETYVDQFLWSDPIEYKGIILNPILCKDIVKFNSNVYPLLYDPLRYNSQISTLPRLYFLTDILNHRTDRQYLQDNIVLAQMYDSLLMLLEMVLQQRFVFIENKKKWFLRVWTTDEEYVDVKVKDFETIRQIILHQNGVDYDDTFIHDDIRNWIEEQERYNKTPKSTIEDYKEAFMMEIGSCNVEEFKKVSLRTFNRIVDKILSRENYVMQTTASMSGFVTFKGKIDHWLVTNKKNNMYDKYFKEVK